MDHTEPHFIYVLAILFTADRNHVVLMRRQRPAWQAGRVNALGGKLRRGEGATEAARREVREEAGVDIPADAWEEFLVWDDRDYRLHVLRTFSPLASEARTAEDQEVFLAAVAALPAEVIENLRWLIPLALDHHVAIPIHVRSADTDGSGLTEPVVREGGDAR